MNFDTLNNNPELDDNSQFDTSYNDDYDFMAEYDEIMSDIADDWENNEYEDDVTGDIARKGKRSYNKLKDGDNKYKKEFAEELTMLNDLLDEVNKFGKSLDKKYESMSGSKTKGVSKYTNDLIQSIITTN